MRIIGNQELDMNEPLWRYFKTERFLELLQSSHLYFASAREFYDPFEGAVAVLSAGFPIDPRYAEVEHNERAFEELRRLTKISCWHRASYESDAMWQLYAGLRKGVAIRTTASRISTCYQQCKTEPPQQLKSEPLTYNMVPFRRHLDYKRRAYENSNFASARPFATSDCKTAWCIA